MAGLEILGHVVKDACFGGTQLILVLHLLYLLAMFNHPSELVVGDIVEDKPPARWFRPAGGPPAGPAGSAGDLQRNRLVPAGSSRLEWVPAGSRQLMTNTLVIGQSIKPPLPQYSLLILHSVAFSSSQAVCGCLWLSGLYGVLIENSNISCNIYLAVKLSYIIYGIL